jgi:hypothetical protein
MYVQYCTPVCLPTKIIIQLSVNSKWFLYLASIEAMRKKQLQSENRPLEKPASAVIQKQHKKKLPILQAVAQDHLERMKHHPDDHVDDKRIRIVWFPKHLCIWSETTVYNNSLKLIQFLST